MSWTLFWDMHSGGGTKVEPYNKIYIEAPEEQAVIIFGKMFDRDPYNETCSCCGGDYSIDEYETLEQASAYHRRCRWDEAKKNWVEEPDTQYDKNATLVTLEEYVSCKDVLVIYYKDIKEEYKPTWFVSGTTNILVMIKENDQLLKEELLIIIRKYIDKFDEFERWSRRTGIETTDLVNKQYELWKLFDYVNEKLSV